MNYEHGEPGGVLTEFQELAPVRLVVNDRLGRHVAALRQARGYTLRSMEDRLGITKCNLSAMENGHRNITIATMRKLAAVLDCEFVIGAS